MKDIKTKIYCNYRHEEKVNGMWVEVPMRKNYLEGEISEDTYNKIVGEDTVAFFLSIGATETITYYTRFGRVKQLISEAPGGEKRAIYDFTFIDEEVA